MMLGPFALKSGLVQQGNGNDRIADLISGMMREEGPEALAAGGVIGPENLVLC